jgi:p-aminobenzoyl-glutamate transporter AbgT
MLPLKPRLPIKPFEQIIASVERVGNLLPHPFFLFIILIIFFLSYLLNALGVAIVHPGLAESTYQGEAKTIKVVNLLKAWARIPLGYSVPVASVGPLGIGARTGLSAL